MRKELMDIKKDKNITNEIQPLCLQVKTCTRFRQFIISHLTSYPAPLPLSTQGSEFLRAAAYKTLLDSKIQK